MTKAPESEAFSGERVTGIEPALSAWEADVLPLNYTRRRRKPYTKCPKSGASDPISPVRE